MIPCNYSVIHMSVTYRDNHQVYITDNEQLSLQNKLLELSQSRYHVAILTCDLQEALDMLSHVSNKLHSLHVPSFYTRYRQKADLTIYYLVDYWIHKVYKACYRKIVLLCHCCNSPEYMQCKYYFLQLPHHHTIFYTQVLTFKIICFFNDLWYTILSLPFQDQKQKSINHFVITYTIIM